MTSIRSTSFSLAMDPLSFGAAATSVGASFGVSFGMALASGVAAPATTVVAPAAAVTAGAAATASGAAAVAATAVACLAPIAVPVAGIAVAAAWFMSGSETAAKNSCELLGKGAFGEVVLRRDHYGNKFAFKRVSRAVLRHRQLEHSMEAEVAALKLCQDSPFVVRMFHHFTTASHEILVFEALADILKVYASSNLFGSLAQIRMHVACVATGLSHIHGKNVIHRDLKPSNLLVDQTSGLCKICDFGSAKVTRDGRAWSHIGTPNYMAPEVVEKMVHSKEADYFGLGCTIYELFTGEALFPGQPNEAFAAIMSGLGARLLEKAQAGWKCWRVNGSWNKRKKTKPASSIAQHWLQTA